MRKPLLIAGAVVGVVILIGAALVAYAVLNLNSIIKSRRAYVLAKVSDTLGRPVEVQDIKASLGWGVALDITGLKIADDPAFSQLPIVEAGEVVGQAEFVPLIFGHLHLTRFILKSPEIRVVRDRDGQLNLAQIGHKPKGSEERGTEEAPGAERPAEGGGGAKEALGETMLGGLSIGTFSIQDGKVVYRDLGNGGAPLQIGAIDLDVDRFGLSRSFAVALTLAALGDKQNVSVKGKVGPILRGAGLETGKIPLELTVGVGPIVLDKLRSLPALAGAVPARFSIPDPVSVTAKVSGSPDALDFSVDADLSSDHVIYHGAFDKPAGTALKLAATGARAGGKISATRAQLTLADLELKITQIAIENGVTKAHIDTNRFDLARIAAMLPAAAKYKLTGEAETHTQVAIAKPHPEATGTLALSRVTVTPEGGKIPGISNLTGNIRLSGASATIEPTTFDLGSSRATLSAKADSIFEPIRAGFHLSADALKLAELIPSRKSDTPEELRNVSVNGTVAGALGAPQLSATVTSAAGSVQNVAYNNLALDAGWGGHRLDLRSLKLDAFAGAIDASADATLGETPRFNAKANLTGIDMEQALASQKAKAAGVVRGKLAAQLQVSGAGKDFDRIKPSLRGGGRASIRDGKLVGVNVAAQALRKSQGIPGIGDLIPPEIVSRHPELFASNDTDIQSATLGFAINGPRITSHDIAVQSTDYRLAGEGWFDMDKNIDLAAQVVLSKDLSREIQDRKKNVAYLTNQNGEVVVPLQIAGVLPKPKVLPNVQELAQRAAKHAIEQKGSKLLGGFLGGKQQKKGGGLGGFLNSFSP